MSQLTFPPFLKPGDRVTLVSPSGAISGEALRGARERLESWGFEATVARHAAGAWGRYAGTAEQRLGDLQAALDDPRCAAILCSRGGYGAVHLAGRLDFAAFARRPKWLVGFSDITVLHQLVQRAGFASLHAPMARHLAEEPAGSPFSLALRDVLSGNFAAPRSPLLEPAPGGFAYACPAHRLNRPGTAAHATLRGGNLAVSHGLRATPYDIPAEGTLLFVEDVDERPHAVERMFYNLRLSGALGKIAGLVVGQFTGYEEDLALGKPLYEALAGLLEPCAGPVCFGFPVGHTARNLPLICGADVTLEVGEKGARLAFNIGRRAPTH